QGPELSSRGYASYRPGFGRAPPRSPVPPPVRRRRGFDATMINRPVAAPSASGPPPLQSPYALSKASPALRRSRRISDRLKACNESVAPPAAAVVDVPGPLISSVRAETLPVSGLNSLRSLASDPPEDIFRS